MPRYFFPMHDGEISPNCKGRRQRGGHRSCAIFGGLLHSGREILEPAKMGDTSLTTRN